LSYELLATPKAPRELDGLPSAIAEGLRIALRLLADEPRSKRFDLKMLEGNRPGPPKFRFRLGEYRVILEIHHDVQEVRVLRVGHRSTVFRGVDRLG
jgi:mRNA interferase RelE/StbE